MKIAKCLSAAFFVSTSLQEIGYCANPSISYVELTDNSTHAGTRKSRSNLKCVETGEDLSVKAVAGIDDNDGTQPTWSASTGTISGNGASATWKGKEDSSISASLSGRSASASVSSVKKDEVKATIFDAETQTFKVVKENFNTYISKLGYQGGLTVTGKVTGALQSVDFYNDGERIGKKIGASGEVTATLGNLSIEIEIPTNVPAVKVKGSAGMNFQKFTAKAEGSFDESLQNPWNLSGTLSAEAGVSLSAGVAVGLPGGVELGNITFTGSTNIKISGTVKGQNRNILLGGSITGEALKVEVTVDWTLGIDYRLAEGSKTFGEPMKKTLDDAIVYTIPN